MRRPALFGLFAAVTFVVAACSSAPDDSSAAADGPAGPLDGTFSQESTSGTTPFTSITFLDDSHYSYIESNCAAMAESDVETGDDDDDAGTSGTSGANPEACIHEGTYVATPSDLALTDDGQSGTIHVALGADSETASDTTTTESLHFDKLTNASNSLVLASKVNGFQANGTTMRKVDSSSGSVVTASAIAAGRQWIDVRMPYCQAANNDYDRECGHTCRRTGAANTAQWNRYRSDCSGFVSWSWNMPAPGKTTATLPSVSRYIPAVDLQPGDALDRPGHHVVMFERWANSAKTSAVIMEEPRCGQVAKEITISFHAGNAPGVHWEGGTFLAIRKRSGLTN